jgi:signal transduction histidine kinase
MSNDLIPAVLQEFGINNALRNLCDQISESTQLNINTSISGNFDPLTTLQKTHLFRFVQEALNNIVKHAHAKHVSVHLFSEKSYLYIEINDDGEGFNTQELQNKNHNGLYNMRERASFLNGIFTLQSSANGTQIKLSFPFNNE